MRQVGIVFHENEARRLIRYLHFRGIESQFEGNFQSENGEMHYVIWIKNEDEIQEAELLFHEFEKNPTDPQFDAPEPEPEPAAHVEEAIKEVGERQFHTYFTYFVMAFCAMVFLIGILQRTELVQQLGADKAKTSLTPIQKQFMFDLPSPNQPFWQGAYGFLVTYFDHKSFSNVEGPLFLKIRQGEVWRLFTPCLLHQDFLHILFNMLWLWYLGRPIERRIGFFRMLLLTLIGGISTNCLQYLMSGPFFIGYSGIVTTLAGFIWMREKRAPWEGYPLTRSTILFLAFFILAIFGLQVASFLIDLFTKYSFTPNIANTAHIAGAIIGIFLGRFKIFAQRVKK